MPSLHTPPSPAATRQCQLSRLPIGTCHGERSYPQRDFFSTSQPALQQADIASHAHTASMPQTSGELSGKCLSSLAQRQLWQGCRRGTHNKRLGPSRQLRGDFHLRCGSPGDHEALVHQAPDHAQRVMQRPLCLLCMQAEQSGTTYADSDECLPTHTGYDL